MEYGCIGEVLQHSFSKQIHSKLTEDSYELIELTSDELSAFMTEKDFKAINVTIPYQQKVLPFIAHLDRDAESIGAVNTIVNRDGELYGYNTDFYGMSMLAFRAGIDFYDKKVLVLGTGGTARTAVAVAKEQGAREVIYVSRKKTTTSCSYDDAYKRHRDAEIIINTTPLGMFPKILGKPIELSKFPKLSGVLDAVYNPLRTPLILEAKKLGIPCEGGLFMLVAQAVRASEIFHGKKYPDGTLEKIYGELEQENTNIVLVGMPCSGKSSVGKLLAEKLGAEYFDSDEKIVERVEMPISAYFQSKGEEAFRDVEGTVLLKAAVLSGAVISTGGGAILRSDNISALRENGKIYFIDRPLEKLTPSEDRPLSSTADELKKLYGERYERYCAVCDVRIDGDGTPEEVCQRILDDFLGK